MPFYVRTLLVTGPPDEVVTAPEGHLEHLRELRSRGKLRAAGEVRDGDGFLEIVEAADLPEANAPAESSALIAGGRASWRRRGGPGGLPAGERARRADDLALRVSNGARRPRRASGAPHPPRPPLAA